MTENKKISDEIENAKRKAINISLSYPIFETLEDLRKDFYLEGSKSQHLQYPRSYLIEDFIVFILENPDIFNRFIEAKFGEEEGEE